MRNYGSMLFFSPLYTINIPLRTSKAFGGVGGGGGGGGWCLGVG